MTVMNNTFSGGGIVAGTSSTVKNNNISNAAVNGIQATGGTVADNRVVDSVGVGIVMPSGTMSSNLIANSGGDGAQIAAATVISNTFTGNKGRALYTANGIPVRIANNNFEFNTGQYDLYNDNPGGPTSYVVATNNWWGTTDTNAIAQRVYDFDDDYTKGRVSFTPKLSAPAQDAPAYVRSMTLTPASPVGIQQVAFAVGFSRPMDTNKNPDVTFYTTAKGSWANYTTSNSQLPSNSVNAIAVDRDGSKWFLTGNGLARFDGANWSVYTAITVTSPFTMSYPLSGQALAIDSAGNKWLSAGMSLIRFDGTNGSVYNTPSSGSPSLGRAIAIDRDGSKWVSFMKGAMSYGVFRFDGTNWTEYTSSNSGFPNSDVNAIAIDYNGVKWFATMNSGVARFDGAAWTTYNTSNSGLPDNYVYSVAIDRDGAKWFGIPSRLVRYDGSIWTTYSLPTGPAYVNPKSIAIDGAGNKWFGLSDPSFSKLGVLRFDGTWLMYDIPGATMPSTSINSIAIDTADNKWIGLGSDGVKVLWGGTDYPIVDNAQWTSSSQFRATYDFTSMIPRGWYSLTVASALGGNGMRIPNYAGSTFQLDYAGYISDDSPPNMNSVAAAGNGTLTTLSANWSGSDAESGISMYSYAIGTTPGSANIINWTNTTSTSVVRSNLTLIQGQPYYVSVKARNGGGIWSQPMPSNRVLGGEVTPTSYPIYLPLTLK
jgi:hypothetical protein